MENKKISPDLKKIKTDLRKFAKKDKAKILQRFFKTGVGEYGEGDVFIGVTVPQIRSVAKIYQDLNIPATLEILKSPIHEERLLALLILKFKFIKGDQRQKEKIYKLYLKNTKHINNWDLIDLSCAYIVGPHLQDKNRLPLYKLAKSKSLWERRISIISTFHFIRNKDFDDTLKLSEILLHDNEDLIQKGVGWMLRELGKKDEPALEKFLKTRYKNMPRTMLRYAIERFEETKRQKYLKGKI